MLKLSLVPVLIEFIEVISYFVECLRFLMVKDLI